MKNYPYSDVGLYTSADQKAYLEDIMREGQRILKLDGYAGNILFPGDRDYEEGECDDSMAAIDTNYPYREFYISVHKRMIEMMSEALPGSEKWIYFERVIMHELVHLVLAPMSNVAGRRYISAKEIENIEENVVEHLMLAIHDQASAARYYASMDTKPRSVSTDSPQTA